MGIKGIDKSLFQAGNGDGSIVCLGEVESRVPFVEPLVKVNFRPFAGPDGEVREVWVAQKCGFIARYSKLVEIFINKEGHLLCHASKSFAANTVSALPVCLVLGKVDCSSSEGPFLEDPSPFVEISVNHIILEVVNCFTDVVWSVARLVKSNESPRLSLTQKTARRAHSLASGDHAVGRAESGLHVLGFGVKVASIALYDTK